MTVRFRRLVRHFFVQFFQADFGSGEDRLSIAAVLGLLAVPGALMSMVLFAKYSSLLRWLRRNFHFDPDIASLPDKYTFITFSIAVAGIVAVLRWDTLFPDRRDYANLAPLPVSSRSILLAKISALTGFVVIFLFDVNAVSAFLFPMIVMEDHGEFREVVRFLLAHLVAVTAAGLWTFMTFLALTGTMMSVMPYGVFRRSRRYVQFACILVLLILFLSASSTGRDIAKLRTGPPGWLEWLPPIWFLGLYQDVQGKAVGSFAALSAFSLKALLVSFLLGAVAYGMSYRWFFLRSAETTEGPPSVIRFPAWLQRLDGIVFRSGFNRASFRFILRTLTRSERHTAMLAATLGLGFALAVQSASGARPGNPVPAGVLAASLMVIYSLLTGLRLSFGLPSEPSANWIFRVCSSDSASPNAVVRFVMYIFLVPATLGSGAIYLITFGAAIALWHILFLLAASSVLIEALIFDFRVIPFTCYWLPLRDNFVFAVAVWLAGLTIFGQAFALTEALLILNPWRFIPFLTAVAAVLLALHYLRSVREPVIWSDTRGQLDLLRIAE